PVDTKLRQGLYPLDDLPAVLGCDGSGIVEAVGLEVNKFQVGDEVYFFHGGIGSIQGNYAEFKTVEEHFVAKKPESLNFTEAAAAPLVLLTAWESLYDRAQIKSGQNVFINAGAGGVGHVAIQLAKIAGANVCTTVSSDEKAEFVKSLGADMTINYKEQDFVEAIMDWTDGKGADIVMDNVGGEWIEKSFSAVAHYGHLVTLLQPDKETDWTVARQRNVAIHLEIMLSPLLFDLKDAQKHQTFILEECARYFDEGKLKIHVSRSMPLAEAANAHTEIESGRTTGKIVLTM
ncbi:MAG: zinc-dependent alcohol dehydrogenase family protein, partial [Gammaproteobacteria bacterium]